MAKTLRHASSWGQQVKQMCIVLAGIETKRQGDMSKGDREVFMNEEFNGWCATLKKKYPDAAINRFLGFTTGKCAVKVDGHYLYRNFQECLRKFHNEYNAMWSKLLAGQVSGKAPEEIWNMFMYQVHALKKGDDADDIVPSGFDVESCERQKWAMAYKCLGPPRELLGTGECHEFLANAPDLSARGGKKRKGENTSRKFIRQKKVKQHQDALLAARVTRGDTAELDLGRRVTIQNLMKLNEKMKDSHFQRLKQLHQITQDPVRKAALEEQMFTVISKPALSFADAERTMVIDLTEPEVTTVDTSESDNGSSSEDDGWKTRDDIEDVDVHAIIDDLFHRSGYVVIPEVRLPACTFDVNTCLFICVRMFVRRYLQFLQMPTGFKIS